MSEWPNVTLGEVLRRVRRKVDVMNGVAYRAVSVTKDGAGLGVKEPFVGGVTNYKSLCRIVSGDVVVRTITAFESPAGVAHEKHNGSHVSGVFLTYEVEPTTLPALLELFFQTPMFWNEMRGRAVGTVLRRKTISDAAFCAIPVPLPSLAEQRRIVDVVAMVDAHVEALGTEANALLRFIRVRRGELVNDASFPAVRAEAAYEFSTGVRRTPDRAQGKHMTPYLRSANIGYGALNLSDVQQMNYEPHEREKFGLEYGDVLVSEGSASAKAVGMPAMWRDELPGPVCFQMTLLRLRAIKDVCTPSFAFHWCMWAYESGKFLDVAGGTSIKHISAKRSSQMVVRLPPVDRQEAAAAELDAIEEQLGDVRSELTRLRMLRATLLTALLSQDIEIPESYDSAQETVS